METRASSRKNKTIKTRFIAIKKYEKMKKVLIIIISLSAIFACSNEKNNSSERQKNTEPSIENVNLEKDLGELESELNEIEVDTLSKKQ